MSNRMEVPVDIGGKIYTMSSDDRYLDEIGPVFEPHMVKLFETLNSDWNVALDIGANVGCTALLFASLAKQVHAFEPAPSTFAFLQRNVKYSGLQNVRTHNFGIGEKEESTTITFNPSHRGGAFVSNLTKVGAGHQTEEIVIRPLDTVVEELELSSVDFMKIDVEGFEGHVLRGGGNTLRRFRPTMVLELNHWCLNAFQRTSVPDFFDLVLGFFPHVAAVDGYRYLDLHDQDQRYAVMYHHIIHMRFPNLIATFDQTTIRRFEAIYAHGF